LAAEIEFKFLIPPERVDVVRAHPLLQAHATEAPKQKPLLSIYYDTPDFRLRDRKLGLRLRKVGASWVQTIKGDTIGSGGMTVREEVEHTVPGKSLDLTLLAGSAFDDLATEQGLEERLKPCFTTDFVRLVWDLTFADGTRVEAALDRGEILTDAGNEPICELELELVSGEVATLETFAAALRQAADLAPGDLSKAKRGYALLARGARG